MANLNKTIMQHAQKQVGIWEWAGSENNPLVLAMFAEAGHSDIKQDAVPWCAAFVGSVLLRAGTKGTGSLLARSYLDWGQKIPLSEAKEGDVVILSGKASWQGHVGFFKGQGAQKLNLLGGNQNDQVNVKAYPASKLLGARRAIARVQIQAKAPPFKPARLQRWQGRQPQPRRAWRQCTPQRRLR